MVGEDNQVEYKDSRWKPILVEAGEAYVPTSYSEERMVVLIYSTKRWQAIPRMDFDTLINMGFVNARDTLLQYKKEK